MAIENRSEFEGMPSPPEGHEISPVSRRFVTAGDVAHITTLYSDPDVPIQAVPEHAGFSNVTTSHYRIAVEHDLARQELGAMPPAPDGDEIKRVESALEPYDAAHAEIVADVEVYVRRPEEDRARIADRERLRLERDPTYRGLQRVAKELETGMASVRLPEARPRRDFTKPPLTKQERYEQDLARLEKLWPVMNRDELAAHFGVSPQTISDRARALRERGIELEEKRGAKTDPQRAERKQFIADHLTMSVGDLVEATGMPAESIVKLRTEVKKELGVPLTSVGRPPDTWVAARNDRARQLFEAGFTGIEIGRILGISPSRARRAVEGLSRQEKDALGIKPGKRAEIDWSRRAAALNALKLSPELAARRLGIDPQLLMIHEETE